MLHDLAVPFHAKDTSGKYHRDCENEVDRWIGEGKFDHLPVFRRSDADPGVRYKRSTQDVFCPGWWSNLRSVGWEDMLSRVLFPFFTEMSDTSVKFYNDVHGDKRSSLDQSIAAFEYLLDIAIKKTVILIVGLDRLKKQADRRRSTPYLSVLLLED